jgi:hypothetical protein
MSLSKSKCWYSNNCLRFLEHALPLRHMALNVTISYIFIVVLRIVYKVSHFDCFDEFRIFYCYAEYRILSIAFFVLC